MYREQASIAVAKAAVAIDMARRALRYAFAAAISCVRSISLSFSILVNYSPPRSKEWIAEDLYGLSGHAQLGG